MYPCHIVYTFYWFTYYFLDALSIAKEGLNQIVRSQMTLNEGNNNFKHVAFMLSTMIHFCDLQHLHILPLHSTPFKLLKRIFFVFVLLCL